MVSTPPLGWKPSLSLEGERAIRDLNRLRVVITRARPAVAVIPTTAGVARRDVDEIGIVRAFSVLESYLSARADSFIRRDLPVPDPPHEIAVYAHSRLISSTFGNFERGTMTLWHLGLGVDLSKFPGRWNRINEFRELRNLLTHGLGYVRPGPIKLKPGIRKRLATVTASPETFVGRVPVGTNDFDDLATLVRDFVLWADAQRS
jgi:hypothetical protein